MPRNNATPAKTLNVEPPDMDSDGLPDLPDEAFAKVEEEMETKAAKGGRRNKGKAKVEEVPVSDMPDLDGPDLDPDMKDPISGSGDIGLATSISEVADRLSDTANSLTNRMESLQGTTQKVLDYIQVRFDELSAELADLRKSFHPILVEATKGSKPAGTLADVAHDKPKDDGTKTVGKLAKACGQSTAKAQQLLDACSKFKNAIPYQKVVDWLASEKCGLTKDQAVKFLAYLDITAEDFDTVDGTDFPKL